MMTCKAARALTVRGLGGGGDAEATAHAEGCGACAAFGRDAARIWVWLGDAALPGGVPARNAGRKAGLIGLAIAAAALLAVVAAVLFPSVMRGPAPAQDPEHGIELRWRALFPADFKGSKREVTARAAQIVEMRLRKRHIAGTARLEGDDSIIVRLPGADAEGAADVKTLLGRVGRVELRPLMNRQEAEVLLKDSIVPDGYEEIQDTSDGQVFGRLPVHTLIRKQPVVTNEDIASAIEEPFLEEKGHFRVRIEFTQAGAAALDVAASELRRSAGRLGIVIDGELVVAPYVNTEKIEGRFHVRDPRRREGREWARTLVTALSTTALPVVIGGIVDGKPAPGVPESEQRY
jgi:SecD-like export protein